MIHVLFGLDVGTPPYGTFSVGSDLAPILVLDIVTDLQVLSARWQLASPDPDVEGQHQMIARWRLAFPADIQGQHRVASCRSPRTRVWLAAPGDIPVWSDLQILVAVEVMVVVVGSLEPQQVELYT